MQRASQPGDEPMRLLFAHLTVRGHFTHLARALARAGHEVAFLAAETVGAPEGVRTVAIRPAREGSATTHHYLQPLERAVLLGQAAYRAARALVREGFRPDAVIAHAGFGPGLYLKDACAGSPLLGWFEWYYAAHGTDADFLDPGAVTPDDELRIRTRNAGLLLELAACDRAVAPTAWQRAQFPEPWRAKLDVLHEGVDADFFAPGPAPDTCLGIPEGAEVVTYVARGLEPYRGFPQFLRAVALLQRRRPRLHAVVVGGDRTWYGPKPADGRTWRETALRELGSDLERDRLVLLPFVPQHQVRDLFRRSDVHVYLTVPFVLSWSVLEAMACGCPLVASDTAPVREVVAHGDNGLLADLHDPGAIADAVEHLLDDRLSAARLGTSARATVLDRYALAKQLARQHALVETMARGSASPSVNLRTPEWRRAGGPAAR